MHVPVLHLLAGPNGAGKTQFFEQVLARRLPNLPFINADHIARERWPDEAEERSYEAARLAADLRSRALSSGTSFITETVFSHPSKLDLVRRAKAGGFHVSLHILLIPEELSVARVQSRVRLGGHSVPEEKIRQRHRRLWKIVRSAVDYSDLAVVYDNSSARRPFREVAKFRQGRLRGAADWPPWTSTELTKKS